MVEEVKRSEKCGSGGKYGKEKCDRLVRGKKVGEEEERSRNRRCGRGKGKDEVLRKLSKVCG